MNTPQQPKLNVDLSKAQDVTCDNCGNYTFQEVVLMKKISALVSPTGKEGIVPIPVFACNACGFINKQFLPYRMEEQDEQSQQTEQTEQRPKLVLE
jgi:uncharacterized Zn finger protein